MSLITFFFIFVAFSAGAETCFAPTGLPNEVEKLLHFEEQLSDIYNDYSPSYRKKYINRLCEKVTYTPWGGDDCKQKYLTEENLKASIYQNAIDICLSGVDTARKLTCYFHANDLFLYPFDEVYLDPCFNAEYSERPGCMTKQFEKKRNVVLRAKQKKNQSP